MATEPVLVMAIDKFRKEYLDWHQTIPFLLQRFGQASRIHKQELVEQKKRQNFEIKDELEKKDKDIDDELLSDSVTF